MKPRKPRKDSLSAKQDAAKNGIPGVPDGISLNSEEMVIWRQMSKVRADWRDFDLILLAKVVALEVKIRDWWSLVDQSGPMIRNKRETLIENPILRSINTLQHQQLSIITKMRVMSHRDARTLNDGYEDAVSYKDHENNVYSLLR